MGQIYYQHRLNTQANIRTQIINAKKANIKAFLQAEQAQQEEDSFWAIRDLVFARGLSLFDVEVLPKKRQE